MKPDRLGDQHSVWRYLKSAFFVTVDVAGLGSVPVNVLAVLGFGILGIAEPALWLVGAGVETAFVTSLAFNPRFQKYVQAKDLRLAGDDPESKQQALITILSRDAQKRLADLRADCERILDVYRTQQAEGYVLDSNREALDRLQWIYTKLLVAQHHLLDPATREPETSLHEKISTLESELQEGSESESLRQSRLATLAILKKRLQNNARRQESLEEIDSDLSRIEAQVDLILENATMQGKPQAISSDIELASDLLGSGIFGEDELAIKELDRSLRKPQPVAKKELS